MQPVITSLLDTDLYKYTMWQAMLHRHPETQAEYTFLCRNQPAFPLAELVPEINRELDALCALNFRSDELAYLRSLRFIRSDFVDFLRIFHFQREFITARANGDQLEIVAAGPQVHVMAFEIYVLAIVNEREDPAPRAVGRRAAPRASVRVLRLRRAPALLGRLAARGRRDLQARGARILQGRVERAVCARPRPGADRHDGA